MSPPSDSARDYERLRVLLRENGILHSAPGQPVQHRDGKPSSWMLYTWGVTMTAEGGHLAARCMLERLATFEATQLATLGQTCVPILMGCIMLGEGKYSGLFVRERRKGHGSMRRVDGPLDRTRGVVVIDDSIASGSSALQAIRALEDEGLRVEGVLGLVGFPHGGLQRLTALGYRAEFIFDIYDDVGMPKGVYVPGRVRATPATWGASAVEDGLHPAVAARQTAELYLKDGLTPLPPSTLDREYDGRGGVFVSFRRRDSDLRIAREGFWHFDADDAVPCRDLVLATVKTIQSAKGRITLDTLDQLKLNVTFLTALEKITPSKLDFWTHGIVVRSQQMDAKIGGALPNTQIFSDEIEQYRHARVTNARLGRYEPHDLYRHGLSKCVEPGESWLHFGFPYDRRADWGRQPWIGAALTARARACLEALEQGLERPRGKPVPTSMIPCPIYTVGVTLYHQGVIGCALSWSGALDECLGRAAESAYRDLRFAARKAGVSLDDVTVSVSILWGRERIGNEPPQRGSSKMRRGIDALSVVQGNKRAIYLPVVPVYSNLSKEQAATSLMDKAGIKGRPLEWATYQCNSWLERDGQVWKMAFGFTDRADAPHSADRWRGDAKLLAAYVQRQLRSDGLPTYMYYPTQGRTVTHGHAARLVHGLAALDMAGRLFGHESWREAARRGLDVCVSHLRTDADGRAICHVPDCPTSHATEAMLLMALCETGEASRLETARGLARTLAALRLSDGRIAPRADARGVNADHDFLPGSTLLALATWAKASDEVEVLADVDGHLHWYARRFRIEHAWGTVGWQTRAWTAIHQITGDPAHAAFVFEMADWALTQQSEVHGAFLTDLHPWGLSFHTAFVAEGMAAAWQLARRLGDEERAAHYEASCREGLRFMNRLYIRPEDTFCTVEPEMAVGGVRGALSASDVRIDYVGHALFALLHSIHVHEQQSVNMSATNT